METRTRAWRRAQKQRIKARRKNYWGSMEKTERHLGILTKTCQLCSRPNCCGNARYFYGPTIQELSFTQLLKKGDDHALGSTNGDRIEQDKTAHQSPRVRRIR